MVKIAIVEDLSEDEAYLWAILSDPSGLDTVEFLWVDNEQRDGCFRAWPFQWRWWRNLAQNQIDQAARSVGKSLSIQVRAFAFPFLHPGQEMVITAPEGNHLDAITDNVETKFKNTRLGREMLVSGRGGIKHRPFHMNFANGSRIMGRIPQRDGKGVKGCKKSDSPILTMEYGFIRADKVKVGDHVLNAEGRWVPVTHVIHDVNDCYRVEGAGSYAVEVSCDHRFYGVINEATTKQERQFSELLYQDVEFLLEDQFYWATPTKFPEMKAEYPDFSTSKNNKVYDVESEDFWWLVGLFVADGWLRGDEYDLPSALNWCSHPHGKGRKKLIRALQNLGATYRIEKRDWSSADQVELSSAPIARWLNANVGRTASTKHLPVWMLSLPDEFKLAYLDGYLAGDGHYNEFKNRWECGSASKELMMMTQLLAQSVGFKVGATQVDPQVTVISGVELKEKPHTSYRLHISLTGHSCEIDDYLVGKVKKVTPIGKQPIVNIQVEDGRSYLGGTIMNHNIHPIWLELDEAQDYPDQGWTEIIETLKMGSEGAVWRAHGVTRGMRDFFYKFTQPGSGWHVHRITGMHRPTWSAEERESKIESYGSRDHPDYRRNVLGLHGDATNPLFVLHRLMQCVDSDNESKFNKNEYTFIKINNEMVLDHGDDILPLLDFPTNHLQYQNFWLGCDVGYTNHPSEIVIFAETKERAKDAEQGVRKPDIKRRTALKMIARIRLERISHGHQVAAILWLINFYKPRAFAMDKTGLGLPLFQDIQQHARDSTDYRIAVDTIKGYNFSSKILVDFDDSIEVDEYKGDIIKDSGIERNVLEYSSDRLRTFVDDERIILPNQTDMIKEFQGQTWVYDKSTMDMYGRKKIYSKGSFHVLDAARMAVLGYAQFAIEEMTKVEKHEPVTEIFLY